MSRPVVAVVGAGVAGLVAARRLAASHDVVVLDKGRGVGGRCATRRLAGAVVDHGAQFITTHTPWFRGVVEAWEGRGVTEPWFTGRVGPGGVTDPDGHVRHRGTVAMTGVPKHLAAGLDVRTGTRVDAVAPAESGWSLGCITADGSRHALRADAVVLTAPVPQALELFAASGLQLADDDRSVLEAVRYDRCLAALVPLDGPSRLPAPGAVDPDAGPVDWLADNLRKGISPRPALTLHATAAASRDHWDDDPSAVVADLVAAAGESVGRHLPALADLGAAQLHRWRYARPVEVRPEPCRPLGGLPPVVLAGDAFGRAAVEGAASSGAAAADAVAASLEALRDRS